VLARGMVCAGGVARDVDTGFACSGSGQVVVVPGLEGRGRWEGAPGAGVGEGYVFVCR
jgi:hypothetical protein